jgi:O-acetyl-ADP-ribose deacetylase (regulator of RNase III)
MEEVSMIEYVKGNILHEQSDAIVNTVNTVGVMGKGLALQFKKAFPHNYTVYKMACDDKSLVTGAVLPVAMESLNPPYYIINFPTKAHWKGKSKIEFIEKGLDSLISEAKKLNLKSVSIPALGSGLGGLNWNEVEVLIKDKLSLVPEIEWRVFPPQSSPDAKLMPNKTAKPPMTAGRAAVVSLIDRYINKGLAYDLSLLEVQKLVYFLTASGEQLNNKVKFSKHHYGPYADVLRHVLNKMEGHFISGYADGQNKPDVSIHLLPKASQDAEDFLRTHQDTLNRFKEVSELVKGFESPYGMELLSTVHWVATQDIPEQKSNVEAIVERVHKWSRRKASMKPHQIKMAWQVLSDRGWLDKYAQV